MDFERVLQKVQKPARYTGGEYGQTVKDKSANPVRVALCFPDTYEIGMSNLGMQIIYGVLNEMDGVWCERVFHPWSDMEEIIRGGGVPLCALESGDPVSRFDIVAFSIGYELSYTSVLNMLALSGIGVRAEDRREDSPLVIAGGTCCFNPEPMSDFIDLFVVGEGEEAIVDIVAAFIDTVGTERRALGHIFETAAAKAGFLTAASNIAGVYVPSLYDVSYFDDGRVKNISPRAGVPLPVVKRIVKDLDSAYFPSRPIVPSTGVVHDRAVLELFRGCIRGCRFCHAGHVGRPVRARSCGTLIKQGISALRNSGYDEIALLSLSSSDYEHILNLCDGLMDWCEPRNISLSLPSLRADNFSIGLMERIQKIRKSGLTFAPEAGSQRLRDAINKNVTDDDLLRTCGIAFEGGWNSVKLYFMLGLPTETDGDVAAIADLSYSVLNIWKKHSKAKHKGVRIAVSTSCFVPKPHTPFQWEPQIPMDEYLRRVELLRGLLKSKAITYSWHAAEQGFVEAALSRGDRRVGSVIYAAWRGGARLDSWSECFSLEKWLTAFEERGLDASDYANRERAHGEIFPWNTVSAGLSDEYLWKGREASRESRLTPDCRDTCLGCGACGL